jgi:NDP-sugar pyrophosphorylase family protein
MHILIPMAGRGSRFNNTEYTLPKPLIKINNRPLIEYVIESLDLEGDYIFVVQKWHIEEYAIDKILRKIKPDCRIIDIDYTTEGPACSALLAKELIDNETELLITNCDQIMNWDGKTFLNTCKLYDGTIVTYYENSNKNSYAKINTKGRVVEVKEKQVISNISLNGIHYWKRGRYFVESAEQMISNGERYNSEFYIGPSYNYLISKGYEIGIHHIPNEQHNAVGIPEDLEKYLIRRNL